MSYNINMKLENLLESEQATAILNRCLPGMLQRVQSNPQAVKLSVEQMVRYARIPQGEALLQKLDAALSTLNTPENAVSPAEKQLIALFHSLDEADKAAPVPAASHHQETIYP